MPTPTKDGSEAKPGETLAQHKERVMNAAQEHARAQTNAAKATTERPPAGFPVSPATPSSIPEFMRDRGVQPPEVSQKPPEGSSGPQVLVNGKPTADEPEWQKMARERGWKTAEDAINSYRNLEREFHSRMNQNRPPTPTYTPPPPQYVMPYPQVPYVPPQPQVNVVQQLARRHGISVEDAERLVPLVAEVSQAAVENGRLEERQRYEPIVADLQRKVARSEEYVEIANDPAMRVPRVQFEVNRLLMENPSVFTMERQPLKWALDVALRNIAQELVRTEPSYQAYPTQPPVTAGQPTGTRGTGSQEGPKIDLAGNYFKLKTAEEKKEVLRALGVTQD